jgi:hypothetical protein
MGPSSHNQGSDVVERTLHLVDEKHYKEIFVPSVSGDEDALNELLEWASLLSTGWEPRSQAYALVKDARGHWKTAVEARKAGESPARTADFAARVLNVAFGALSAYRRPCYVLPRGLSLSSLEPLGLTELSKYLGDSNKLLEGVTLAPSWMKDTTKATSGHGPSAGLYLGKDKVVPFLKTLRSDLRGHAKKLEAAGIAPEPALTLFLSAAIEAKETHAGILELEDVLGGPRGVLFPPETIRSQALANLPGAVTREVRKALGQAFEPPAPLKEALTRPAEVPKKDYGPPVPYSPKADYKEGQKIEHKKFGQGEVKRIVDRNKILVEFSSGERTLAQNSVPPPPSDEQPIAAETAPAPEAAAPAPEAAPPSPPPASL